MSLNSNKSYNFFIKSKEIVYNELNHYKTNRNYYTKSLNSKRINNFLKKNNNNNNNKQKYNNLFKNKSHLFPQIPNEKIKISKIKKNINLKNYLMTNNILVPSDPLFDVKTKKNTRNHNINFNIINQLNSNNESNINKTYSKTINHNIRIKTYNIKRYSFGSVFIENKNKSNSHNKSFNTFSLKEKNKLNKNIFKYHSDKKNNKNIFDRFTKTNCNPMKLFLNKKSLSNLEDLPSKNINTNNIHTIKYNKYNTIIKDYYCKTEAGRDLLGKTKINQDSYLSLLNIYNLKNFSVFAVFDGHGINGHLVSKYVKEYFQNFFLNIDNNDNNDNLNSHDENIIYKKLSNETLIKEKSKLLENFLLEKPFSIQYSGTTCIIIIFIEDNILCYNIGDSRAVYINKKYNCIPISKDHKPEIPKEKSRIEECGGIVQKDYMNHGVYRVYIKNGKYPGLAMSRSIGDYVAKSLGVINEPDFYEINIIKNNIQSVILSSDGLWDVVNYNQIEKIAEEYIIRDDCVGCVNALIDEAKKNNRKKNISCDDITIIVIFFEIKN